MYIKISLKIRSVHQDKYKKNVLKFVETLGLWNQFNNFSEMDEISLTGPVNVGGLMFHPTYGKFIEKYNLFLLAFI